MNLLDQEHKELVYKLKEATDIDDNNTAILRLIEHDWDLERAVENKQVDLTQNRRTGIIEQQDDEAIPLLDSRIADLAGNEEVEMTVKGDERLTRFPQYKWESADTRKWKTSARKKLMGRCEAITYDYQRFNKIQFAQIEEMVAMNIFGIDQKIATQALKTNNLLCAYSTDQRKQAMEVRVAIEEIAGEEDILIQVIPLLVRTNQDIQKKNYDSYVVSVFRVKSKDASKPDQFVDWDAKTHKHWESVLDSCLGLPQGMMAYPKNGFLREMNQEEPTFRVCDICFGETPASAFLERNQHIIRPGMYLFATTSAIAMIWNPLGWTGIALGVARGGLFFATSVMLAVTDSRAEGSLNICLNLPTFIKHMGNTLLKEGIHYYLRKVAQQHRGLTALERIIINAFGDGFDEAQIFSFVSCVYTIVMEMRNCPIKEMPVMRLVTACHELFSCVLTPKKAERMLEDVRAELGQEEFEKICSLQERMAQLELELNNFRAIDADDEQLQDKSNELEKCKSELTEAQKQFQAMKSRQLEQSFLKMKQLEKLKQEVEQLESDENIRRKKEEIGRIENEITNLQIEHLQQFMEEEMSDCSAKDDFKEQVIRRSAQRKSIEDNHRVIQTIFEMDAEVLFKYAAATQSTISFPTGERLKVRINDQIDFSPDTVSKLFGSSEAETEEFVKVMKATADFQNGLLTERELIGKMNESIISHEHITRTESAKFTEWLKTCVSEEDSSFTSTLSAQQCRLLKNALSSVSPEDKRLAVKAALILAKGLKLSISNRLADCVEITITYASTKADEIFKRLSELETTGRSHDLNHTEGMDGLLEEDIDALRLENFPLPKVFSCLLNRIAQPGHLSDQHVGSYRQQMEDLLRNRLLPSETFCFTSRGGVPANPAANDKERNAGEDIEFYL